MKKLPIWWFAFWSGALFAQINQSQHTLAVVAGPNWFEQYDGWFSPYFTYSRRTGFSAGADYTYLIGGHWHVKASLRYHALRSTAESGWITYASEFAPDGTYTPDPNLPHYVTVKNTDRLWQYSIGIRWISKPGIWRFYTDVETGLSDYIEPEGIGKAPLKVTVGAGLGMAWQPARSKFAFFAGPAVRYLVRDLTSDFRTAGLPDFLVTSLETGVRYHF